MYKFYPFLLHPIAHCAVWVANYFIYREESDKSILKKKTVDILS